jgi:transcriptional regulator with XRE-family HTH domain
MHTKSSFSQSTRRPAPLLRRVQGRFGRRVKTLRKQKGLTPDQLGKDCGISSTKIAKIESGEVNVSLSTMTHLAQRLGIKVDGLLKRLV